MDTKAICKKLGVTPAGLELLAQAAADPGGYAYAIGFAGKESCAARASLVRDGLFTDDSTDIRARITDAGRAVVAQARALGW